MANWLYVAALCSSLLVYGSVARATLIFSNFSNTYRNNVIYMDSILFDLSNNNTWSRNSSSSSSSSVNKVRSFLDCARHCASHNSCETFTYVKDSSGVASCRGHVKKMTSAGVNDDVIGARSYDLTGLRRVPEPDPCEAGNHMVLDDAWRDIQGQVSGRYCDQSTWTPGWYRFFLGGADADMLTSCPSGACATDMAVWLDLQGKTLPKVEEEMTVTTCSRWMGKCCYNKAWARPVTIRNCGPFYVYNVPKPAVCNQAYCITKRP